MATPTSRLLFSRSTASISTSCSSSSLLRRPFTSSLPSHSDSKPSPDQPSIWNMLLNPKAAIPSSSSPSSATPGSTSYTSSQIQTNLQGPSLFNPSSSPPASGSIKITAPGASPYNKEASLWLDGPEAKATADALFALEASALKGPYDTSSPYYNPNFNIAPFSTSPTPLPQLVLDNLALVASSSSSTPPPTRLPPSSLPTYVSPFNASRSFNPTLQTLPRLASPPTDDPDVRWTQLSQEFKVLHKRKVPNHWMGRTFEFPPGGVGRVLTRFNWVIVSSNMRVEEKRKMRFERNSDKKWRIGRDRHMRRFAVAMRRNVQIVHGLRQRGQSPVI